MSVMKLTVHAEVEGGEQPLVYEGTDPEEVRFFLKGLAGVKRLSFHLLAESGTGEQKAFTRTVRVEEKMAPAIEDALSFLDELNPSYTNEPVQPRGEEANEGETVTIAKDDIGVLNV